MKKIDCYELYDEQFYSLLAIPIWGGFMLVGSGMDKPAEVMFIPKKALKELIKIGNN